MTNWFQTEECFSFYRSLGFIEPFRCLVERDGVEKGRMVGYIQKDGGRLKQFFSRRAIINGGPMLADDITEDELMGLLTKCKQELKKKAIYIETRNFDDYARYKEIFSSAGFNYEPHYNFVIALTSEDEMFSAMSQNHRRSVKGALKNGAFVVDEPSASDISAFYELLHNLYENKVKAPLFPESFFQKLNQIGRVIVVKDELQQVVGGIAMAVGKDVCYEWYVCGADERNKKIHPSTLATYAGMRYAVTHGFARFDFMGAGAPNDGGYGVRDFKAKFGGQLVEHGRFKCVLNKPLYLVGTLGVKIIKRLKR